MTKDEALKMAIDFLDGSYEAHKVRKACQEALEQPTMTYEQGFDHGYEAHRVEQKLEQSAQEPVAWLNIKDGFEDDIVTNNIREQFGFHGHTVPLYTRPAPLWQGLSDDDLLAIIKKWGNFTGIRLETMDLCRAIEQALRNKNDH